MENALANTTTSGSATKTVRKVTASAMMMNGSGGLGTQILWRGDHMSHVVRLAGGRLRNDDIRRRDVDLQEARATSRRIDFVDIDHPDATKRLRPAFQAIDGEDDQNKASSMMTAITVASA